MFRMLIVDDEPIIVEGLVELFQQTKHLELEIHQAYDGSEALEKAKGLRMDIILTDIEMPEMNGIELQKEALRLWPRCKIIFLTGYNDFDYIQEATRSGAVDFVLKTEGDAPIVHAVEKAIGKLNEELTYEQLIRNTRAQMEKALPALQKEFLSSLLHGEDVAEKQRKARFRELSIPLDAEAPVIVVMGRIDEWRADMSGDDKSLFLYSVANIMEEFFAKHFSLVHLTTDRDRMIWLLQPAADMASVRPEAAGKGLFPFVLGTMEAVQNACKQYLKLVCSFVVSSESYAWEQLSLKFDRLSLLFERGLGLGSEMLLSDERMFTGDREQVRSRVIRVRLLDRYMAQKEKEAFFEHFAQVMEAVGEQEALHAGLSLEIFYELTAIFISHINRLELFPTLSERMNVSKLLSIREHSTWGEVTEFFRRLAEWIFESSDEEVEQETNDVVRLIHEYVEKNIDGDLSLNRLSEIAFLTPFYISRLYKAKTGVSISDYITETRINKAMKLLGETQMKVHEVGKCIGYDSAPYFTRFFKKITKLTPQEYRDSLKRI
ncbi:response regulator [Paenibacillus sp.]|uniref:response regulator n=1 Tax=Paenibacillus sp. TaxID=58172 RepID=UPI002D5AFA95|nr:response regulator [Paenibacillus sp.]HZG55919.1 response regulator [Paenibacillus sp.]